MISLLYCSLSPFTHFSFPLSLCFAFSLSLSLSHQDKDTNSVNTELYSSQQTSEGTFIQLQNILWLPLIAYIYCNVKLGIHDNSMYSTEWLSIVMVS